MSEEMTFKEIEKLEKKRRKKSDVLNVALKTIGSIHNVDCLIGIYVYPDTKTVSSNLIMSDDEELKKAVIMTLLDIIDNLVPDMELIEEE